jgi:hypothetical protein
MSVKLMSMVFDANIPGITTGDAKNIQIVSAATAKFILIALADHANDLGESAYPSVRTLCRKTQVSTRTIQRALRGLEDLGIISSVGTSRLNTVSYSINLEKLRELASVQAPTDGGDIYDTHVNTAMGGDKYDTRGVTILQQKGGKYDTQTIIKPSNNHHINPVSFSKNQNKSVVGSEQTTYNQEGDQVLDDPRLELGKIQAVMVLFRKYWPTSPTEDDQKVREYAQEHGADTVANAINEVLTWEEPENIRRPLGAIRSVLLDQASDQPSKPLRDEMRFIKGRYLHINSIATEEY